MRVGVRVCVRVRLGVRVFLCPIRARVGSCVRSWVRAFLRPRERVFIFAFLCARARPVNWCIDLGLVAWIGIVIG